MASPWTGPLRASQAGDGGEIDLSVVVVSWNVRNLLARCLAALPSAVAPPDGPPPRWEAIVVDNASTDGTPELVRAEFPSVRLIETGANLGYPGGVNVGLRAARGRAIAILNADTEPCPDSLARLAAYLDAHAGVGLVGPRLIYPDGRDQSSRRRFPTLATALLESTCLQDWFPNSPAVRRYTMADVPAAVSGPVDWLVGASLMVRRAAYLAAGGLDEGFFMYSEELEWAHRLHRGGWAAHYVADATVIHHEGKSSEQNLAARHINFQASKRRYFRLTHGAWTDPLLRAVLTLNYLYRLAEEGGKHLLSPNLRPLRRHRLRAYRAALLAQLEPDTPATASPSSPVAAGGCEQGAGGLSQIPPHQYQHEHGPANDCGPYSASIALRHWQPTAPDGKTVGRLIRARLPWPSMVRGATFPFGLSRFFARRGFSGQAGQRGRLDQLKRAVAAGCPTIVLVHPAGSPWLTRHYRVLIGYDDAAQRFDFVDPGLPDARRPTPGNHSVDYATFWREWHGGGWGPCYRRWFLPVYPLTRATSGTTKPAATASSRQGDP